MIRIRILFLTAFISISLFICSVIGFLTCINFKAYSNSLNDSLINAYSKKGEEIALDCIEIIDNNTYYNSLHEISDKYENTNYGIYVRFPYHVIQTVNYTGNTIYEGKHNFRVVFLNGYIFYESKHGDKTLDVKVSIPYNNECAYSQLWKNRYTFIAVGAITGGGFIASMILLARFAKTNPLKSPKFIKKLPSTWYLLAGFGVTATFILLIYICNKLTFDIYTLYNSILILPILILALFFTAFISGIGKRFAEKRFTNELFIYKIGKKYGVKTQGIVLSIYLLILIIATVLLSYFVWGFAWLILLAIITPFWILHIRNIMKLSSFTDRYCNGDWSEYPTDEPLLLSSISGNFYQLSASMQATVEKSVRNERTKTELITNVSHDIKTPLTSIINYTELLKNENNSDEQKEEYLSVLSKNSARMKKLIEDLIEASKAATGNIELHPVECNIDTLLSQAIVEREPDAALRNLKFVFIKKHDPVLITIDGEKLYRVFDNLLSNAIKYSLSGSRIYVDLTYDDVVNIEFKNITEDQITISPEELTERFVKGDISRHSDGSGLGLAICKNLVELMGGKLKIDIDGDQFMVTLNFPLLQDND